MKMSSYPAGLFSWVDLMTGDASKAKQFYGSLFGWTGEDNESDNGPYTMFSLGDAHVAGMGQLSEDMKAAGAPAAWNNYVTVADADATVARAKELGATVHMDTHEIAPAGRMAIFADPTGAAISIWQPNMHPGAGVVNEPGSFCWNELSTGDPAAAKDFYAGLFGWTFDDHDMGGQIYSEIKLGDRSNGGLMKTPDEMENVPPHWAVYFSVDDCDAAVAKIGSLGGQPCMPEPVTIEAGRFCAVMDDQGTYFYVMALAE